MTSQLETLLRVSLSQGANYKQKQMLKSDNFGQVLAQTLAARRKSLRLQSLWFFGPCGLLLFTQGVLVAIFGFRPDEVASAFWPMAPIILMQLPIYIERRATLSRLETLAALWFLTEDKENEGSTEPTAELLELFPTAHF